jgi:hypothetical protein
LGPLGTTATSQSAPGDDEKNWWNEWQGKPKYSEKTCPSAALSTTDPTCCPEAKPGRSGGKPATNRLSYGTALPYRKIHNRMHSMNVGIDFSSKSSIAIIHITEFFY